MVITSIRAFLRLETDYRIHGFTDPEQAAGLLEREQVDVVITDYLMPIMTGIQLLTRAKEAQPETTRVLLTGHADARFRPSTKCRYFNTSRNPGTTQPCC